MSYNYSQYVNSLQSLLVAQDTNGQANLNAMLPNIIDYAEQRIYRDLNLLTTLQPIVSTTTAYNRAMAVPQQTIVVEQVNFITPANTLPDAGTRNPLDRRSIDYINAAWPTTTTLGISPSVPTYYALQNNNSAFTSTASTQTMLMAPPPDSTYAVEFIVTIRPTPLSPTNPNTFLTIFLPDLFLAASMIFAAAYQRDFGAAGTVDQFGLGMTWEKQYLELKASAETEEARRKAMNMNIAAPMPSAPPIGQPR